MMRKLFIMAILLLQLIGVAAQEIEEDSVKNETIALVDRIEKTSLDDVMKAIIKVESQGNPRAFNRNGNCAGILQITPSLVKECNNILKAKKSSKRYSLQDRFNAQRSKEMFKLFQSKYNPSNDTEKAIRIWNGGPNYSKRGTQRYYAKVTKYLKN